MSAIGNLAVKSRPSTSSGISSSPPRIGRVANNDGSSNDDRPCNTNASGVRSTDVERQDL